MIACCRLVSAVAAFLFAVIDSCDAVMAQTIAPERCDFKPWPKRTREEPGKPGNIYYTPVAGATEIAPMTVRLRGLADLLFQWRWQGEGLGAKVLQRVEIDKVDALGAVLPFCRSDWVQIDKLGLTNHVLLPSAAGAQWVVRIFERNQTPDISVLDSEQSSIIVSGPLAAAPDVTPRPAMPIDAFLDLPEGQASVCMQNASVPADARQVGTWRLPNGALNVPGTLYAYGGRHVYLRAVGAPGTVGVTFYAKMGGMARAPVPICRMELALTPAMGTWWKATIPWGPDAGGRWFVKLESSKGQGDFSLELMSDRATPGVVKPESISSASSDAYTCVRRALPQRPTDNNLSAAFFQGAYALSIRTNLPSKTSAGVRRTVVNALLAAINNWRTACVLCSPYQFSVIDIDGTVYVPERMLQGELENYRATLMHNYPWQTGLWPEKYTGYFLTPSKFVAVSNTPRQRSRFCVQTNEDDFGFSARESPLCRPTTTTSLRERRVILTWPTTTLDCTPSGEIATNVVACWNQTTVIKFNLRDFSFYAGDIGTVLLGDAPRRVDLIRVFTHEVGHWFGLGHLDGENSIMSGRFGVARCIDDVALERVNAIAIGAAARDNVSAALTYE